MCTSREVSLQSVGAGSELRIAVDCRSNLSLLELLVDLMSPTTRYNISMS